MWKRDNQFLVLPHWRCRLARRSCKYLSDAIVSSSSLLRAENFSLWQRIHSFSLHKNNMILLIAVKYQIYGKEISHVET